MLIKIPNIISRIVQEFYMHKANELSIFINAILNETFCFTSQEIGISKFLSFSSSLVFIHPEVNKRMEFFFRSRRRTNEIKKKKKLDVLQ